MDELITTDVPDTENEGDLYEHNPNTRYMSPMKPAWHLNEFEMHNAHLLCMEHLVVFHYGAEQKSMERNETIVITGWIQRNRQIPVARQCLYTQAPFHYVRQHRAKE